MTVKIEKKLCIISHQRNVNQDRKITTSHPQGYIGIIKRQIITTVDQVIDKLEPSFISGETVRWDCHFGK